MNSQSTHPATTANTGRPRIYIDWDQVGDLLEKQYTAVAIAAHLGIAEDTLRKRCPVDLGCGFSEFSNKRRMRGLEGLRAKQFEVAMAGNVTMLIWLGKQYLGQTDKAEISKAGQNAERLARQLAESLRMAEQLITDDIELDSVIDAFAESHEIDSSILRHYLSRTLDRIPERVRGMISGLSL
jgi:hypothetical protein